MILFTRPTIILIIPNRKFTATVDIHKNDVISMWRYNTLKLRCRTSFYEALFSRGCHLKEDFGTSIGCSTTRQFKTYPIPLVVWRHYQSHESSVHSVEWISCKIKTTLWPQFQHWQRFSRVWLTRVQSDTLGFLFSSRYSPAHLVNKHAIITVYHHHH